MGFLRTLFGRSGPPVRPYVDEGLKLTTTLIHLLKLDDWPEGTPVYSKQETRVIERECQGFQQMLNAEAQRRGKQATEVSEMQRSLAAEALRCLAEPAMGMGWELDGDCPEDWKARVSTYLKAWAMNLDPDTLLGVAQLLALAGHEAEARQSAGIVACWFPSYAPRFFAGADNSDLVASITARAREIMGEVSKKRLRLRGLNADDSMLAIWKVLFSPQLQEGYGAEESRKWTEALIAKIANGDEAGFCSQYNSLIPKIKVILSGCPRHSMANPPWSMVSLDMRVGLIPWVTPAFDKGFAILLKTGSALEKRFGDVLPFAFFLRGGPGDTRETAFRVCAPANAVRASAEHWLMRAYLNRREQGSHATMADRAGRTYSVHRYIDQNGADKAVFFDTADSFRREKEDFGELLQDLI